MHTLDHLRRPAGVPGGAPKPPKLGVWGAPPKGLAPCCWPKAPNPELPPPPTAPPKGLAAPCCCGWPKGVGCTKGDCAWCCPNGVTGCCCCPNGVAGCPNAPKLPTPCVPKLPMPCAAPPAAATCAKGDDGAAAVAIAPKALLWDTPAAAVADPKGVGVADAYFPNPPMAWPSVGVDTPSPPGLAVTPKLAVDP